MGELQSGRKLLQCNTRNVFILSNFQLSTLEALGLFCNNNSRHVCTNENYIFCGLTTGTILVFLSDTFELAKTLEEKESFLWKIQANNWIKTFSLQFPLILVWTKIVCCNNRGLCYYLGYKNLGCCGKRQVLV